MNGSQPGVGVSCLAWSEQLSSGHGDSLAPEEAPGTGPGPQHEQPPHSETGFFGSALSGAALS